MTPSETTATGKVEGLPEKPAKAPAEKLVKTPVKAPKTVKTAFGLGLASILGGIGILGAFKRKKKEN